MTMTSDHSLHPRSTDPITSRHGVQRTIPLRMRVLTAAEQLVEFTDTELTRQVNMYGHIADRNVVARTRLSLERQGHIERRPLTIEDEQLTFRLVQ